MLNKAKLLSGILALAAVGLIWLCFWAYIGAKLNSSHTGRVEVPNHSFPYSATINVTVFDGNEAASSCSGVMLGRNTALTASHCVKKEIVSGIYRDIVVTGQSSNGIVVAKAISVKTPNLNKPNEVRDLESDWAILELDKSIGDFLGYFSEVSKPREGVDSILVGFKGLETFGYIKQRSMACSVKDVNGTDELYTHDCDMEKGFSGGPIIQWTEGIPLVVAINIGSSQGEKGDVNIAISPLIFYKNQANIKQL